jgi:hypothetical protein
VHIQDGGTVLGAILCSYRLLSSCQRTLGTVLRPFCRTRNLVALHRIKQFSHKTVAPSKDASTAIAETLTAGHAEIQIVKIEHLLAYETYLVCCVHRLHLSTWCTVEEL